MKRHVIYDNYDVISDENMKEAKSFIIEREFFDADKDGFIERTDEYGMTVKLSEEDFAKSITDDDIYNECYENNRIWFEDELAQLKEVDKGNTIIALADLGLWNGRRTGYKEYDSLDKIMYSNCDYETVYVDSNGDLRKEESHHDGSNSILYRYWKEGLTDTQRDNFLDKCYNGNLTQRDITRYTRKAGLEIADTYGWKVRR